jgi:hypothetical protein
MRLNDFAAQYLRPPKIGSQPCLPAFHAPTPEPVADEKAHAVTNKPLDVQPWHGAHLGDERVHIHV